MVVYVSDIYDNDKDSQYDRLFYYYGVKFDIVVGLQKVLTRLYKMQKVHRKNMKTKLVSLFLSSYQKEELIYEH